MTLQQIQQVAAALGTIEEFNPLWAALETVFTASIEEANERATAPETDESKRQGWCFYERALKTQWNELCDLRSGEWQNYAWVKQALAQQQGEKEREG